MKPKIPVPAGLCLPKEVKPVGRKKVVKKKKSAAAIRGRAARRKGHQFEREIAIMFRTLGYPKACRNLEYQEGKGIDIANTGIYDIQCKRGKTYTSIAAIEEVPRKEGRVPLLIAKADRGYTVVCMPIKHFVDLTKKLVEQN